MAKIRVIFLCTGNSCRSQMAEAFLRKYGNDTFEVFSAGLKPKPIHPFTYQVMKEVGLDLADQFSKSVNEYLGKSIFQYLITVCDIKEEDCPTSWVLVDDVIVWAFEDPLIAQGSEEEKLEKFRQVRDQIKEKILNWLKEFNIPSAAALNK